MAMNTKAQVQLLRGNMPQLKSLTLEEGALFYEKTSGILFTSSGSDGRKLGYMRGRDTRKDGFGTIIYVSPNGSNDGYGFTKDDAVHCIARAIDIACYISNQYGVFIYLLGNVNWFDDEYNEALSLVSGRMGLPCMITIQTDTSLSEPAHINFSGIRLFQSCVYFSNVIIDTIEPYDFVPEGIRDIAWYIGSNSALYFYDCTLNNAHFARGLNLSDNSYIYMSNSIYNITLSAKRGLLTTLNSHFNADNFQINGTFSDAVMRIDLNSCLSVRNCSGTCTGQRFRVINFSHVCLYGAGPNAIPGTIAPEADETSSYA